MLFWDTIRSLGAFGGVEPTKQFCFGRETRKAPYGSTQVLVLKFVIGFFLFIVACLVVLVIIGNIIFQNSFESGRKNFKTTLGTMLNKTVELQNVTNRILIETGNSGSTTSLDTLIVQQQSTQNTTNSLLKEVRHLNFLRYFILMLVAVLILFVPAFGLLGGLTHWKEFVAYAVKLGYMMLVCTWILFAVHFPFAVVTQDVCASVDSYISGSPKNVSSSSETIQQLASIVTILAQCSNSSLFVESVNPNSFMEQYISGLNTYLTQEDSQHRYFGIVLNNVTSSLDLDFVKSNNATRTNVQTYVSKILLFAYDLIPSFNAANNCSDVGSSFKDVRDNGCVGMLSSVTILWVVFFLLGVFLFPVVFANCLGYKRFRKKRFVIPKERKPEGDVDVALNVA